MSTPTVSLVDRLYECAFFPDLWPGVLDEIAEVGGGRGGVLFTANSQADILRWAASPAIQAEMSDYVSGGWLIQGGRLGRSLGAQHSGFMTDLDLFTPAELDEDPLYRDFLRPRGYGWAAGTVMVLPTNDVLVATVERQFAQGPADAASVARLDEVRPHLARAALISARLHMERAKTAATTLGMLGLPAAVLDPKRRVIAANRQIEELGEHVRWRARDQVSLRDSAADGLFQAAVARLDGGEAGPAVGAVQSFVVRGAQDNPEMVAHVVPIRGVAHDLFARSAAILLLTPVTLPQAPPVELIQSLFDLTAAEARIARGLAGGNSIAEIAVTRQVSEGTVRSQVRQILDKTGCHRQAEVVALLSGVSAAAGIWPDGD